jgi:hypothetical protein
MDRRDPTPEHRPGVARTPGGCAVARRRLARAGVLAATVLLAACGGSAGAGKSTATTATTPVVLGGTQDEAVGITVDGIRCETQEQVLFHIHAHLAVFVAGAPATVPEGIGIAPPRQVDQTTDGPFVSAGSCFYWLHSHTADGIVHIESPIRRTFTLGNYFDVWNQPLSAARVATATGPVTAFVNGRPFTGDPRTIPLGAHSVIQLDVGTKVAPVPYTFAQGL